jgi:rhodanese-related sulfurtransferase
VRTPDEFKTAHIPGATNVDFNGAAFKSEMGKLDKSKTYLLHCQAGGRSSRAEKLMKDAGFQSVLHLKEGFSEWEGQGKPIEK